MPSEESEMSVMEIEGYFLVFSSSDIEESDGPTIVFKKSRPTEEELKFMDDGLYDFHNFCTNFPGWKSLHDVMHPDEKPRKLRVIVEEP